MSFQLEQRNLRKSVHKQEVGLPAGPPPKHKVSYALPLQKKKKSQSCCVKYLKQLVYGNPLTTQHWRYFTQECLFLLHKNGCYS